MTIRKMTSEDLITADEKIMAEFGWYRKPPGPTAVNQLDTERGLYGKYEVKVRRVDGGTDPGGKHENCDYFVLDLDHDIHALPALHAYARACGGEYPDLAQDIQHLLMRIVSPKEGWALPDAPTCPYHSTIKAGPTVHHTGDGWAIGWASSCCGPDPFSWDDGGPGVGDVIEWPFKVNWARDEDWRRLGFWVE